jgi:hypothetical protein
VPIDAYCKRCGYTASLLSTPDFRWRAGELPIVVFACPLCLAADQLLLIRLRNRDHRLKINEISRLKFCEWLRERYSPAW